MNDSPQGFEQLLEQYIFKMATQHWIETADPATKTRLMNLYHQVSKAADDAAHRSNQPLIPPTEWEQLLKKLID